MGCAVAGGAFEVAELGPDGGGVSLAAGAGFFAAGFVLPAPAGVDELGDVVPTAADGAAGFCPRAGLPAPGEGVVLGVTAAEGAVVVPGFAPGVVGLDPPGAGGVLGVIAAEGAVGVPGFAPGGVAVAAPGSGCPCIPGSGCPGNGFVAEAEPGVPACGLWVCSAAFWAAAAGSVGPKAAAGA